MKKRGFTLIELMIVVSILGILAAIVLPHFQDHQQQARRAAAKDTLRKVPTQIELYKLDHNGLAPGFLGTGQASDSMIINQFVGTSAPNGMATSSRVPAGQYVHGPYLDRMPVNPFNGKNKIRSISEATAFADAIDPNFGWLYKKETAEIRLSTPDSDPDNVLYIEY
jgi:general secretion pathway protein G